MNRIATAASRLFAAVEDSGNEARFGGGEDSTCLPVLRRRLRVPDGRHRVGCEQAELDRSFHDLAQPGPGVADRPEGETHRRVSSVRSLRTDSVVKSHAGRSPMRLVGPSDVLAVGVKGGRTHLGGGHVVEPPRRNLGNRRAGIAAQRAVARGLRSCRSLASSPLGLCPGGAAHGPPPTSGRIDPGGAPHACGGHEVGGTGSVRSLAGHHHGAVVTGAALRSRSRHQRCFLRIRGVSSAYEESNLESNSSGMPRRPSDREVHEIRN